MSEKLIESLTFKCTDTEKSKAGAIAQAKKFASLSEYLRSLLIQDITAVEEYVNCLAKAVSLTTDTADTFELVPLIDVTPQKPQAQKKPNCYDQLDFLAIPNLSQE